VSDDARKFVRDLGLNYPMLRDGGGRVLGNYGVIAYPETFVIDRQGRIVATRRGPVDDKFMREQVQPLLTEPS
jgi:peroxiredoxin